MDWCRYIQSGWRLLCGGPLQRRPLNGQFRKRRRLWFRCQWCRNGDSIPIESFDLGDYLLYDREKHYLTAVTTMSKSGREDWALLRTDNKDLIRTFTISNIPMRNGLLKPLEITDIFIPSFEQLDRITFVVCAGDNMPFFLLSGEYRHILCTDICGVCRILFYSSHVALNCPCQTRRTSYIPNWCNNGFWWLHAS